MPRLQHEDLHGGANPLEIAVQTAQITTKYLAPLSPEFGSHPGSETGLRPKKLQIAAIQ
jgi:hypothetical protein